jgi:hypothetical protein
MRHEDAMALKLYAAGLCAALIAALVSVPAEAAPKKRVAAPDRTERITIIDENGRARTRITVAPRSFLDAGTNVLPGERKFNDYAIPPYYYPQSIIDNKAGHHRSPLPLPFELPGYQVW